MSPRRILWPLLTALLVPGGAQAAPGDPHVIYSANNFADGAVVLRSDPATGSLEEISRNGPQGTLFERPFDLALEADGDILVADMGTPCTTSLPRCPSDGRIIRVDPLGGRQSLVASGAPLLDPAGIAVAPDGSIYVADNFAANDDGAVIRVDAATGSMTVVAEGVLLDLPFGILVDRDGSLVVSNRVQPGGSCGGAPGRLVRVQTPSGFQQPIVSGALLDYPFGVALDAQDRISVANECGAAGLVRLVSGGLGAITSNSADDLLVTPERLALDPAGDFLVSDYSVGDGDGGIVKVDSDSGAQSLVRQGDLFNHPLGIAAVVNRPPAAALSAEPLVAAGTPARLDASASTDPEGLRLVYEWDLDGDGGFETGSGTTAAVAHSWSSDGQVTARVRVNDPHGGRAVLERPIAVDGSTPVITALRASSRSIAERPRRGRPGVARAAAAAAPPPATRIRFRLSEHARVRIAVGRARRGRRVRTGSPCRVEARRGRRCTRLSRVRVITKDAAAGANSVLVKASSLRPGRFRLDFTAVDAVGHTATPRSLALRVLRPRR